MKTAGKITLEIPVLVSPDGRAHGYIAMNRDGTHTEDISLLYDSYMEPGDEIMPLQLVTVTAVVDLDDLFRANTIQGTVTPNDDSSA